MPTFFAGQTDYIEKLNDVDAAAGAAQDDIDAHIADTTAAHAASAISNTPAGNIAATTVQGAINELDTEKLSASATALPSSFASASLNSITPTGGILSIDGNLLLGTTSAASFDGAGGIGVSRSSLPAIFLENTGTGAQAFMTYVATDSSYRLYNSSTNSELLLVSASGNLLLGTTSAASFTGAGGIGVSRSSLPAIFLENTGTGAQAFLTYVAPDSSYRLYNSTTHSELLLVSASGDLLINQTTNPSSYKLAVTGNVGVTGSIGATSLVDISAAGAGQIKFPATQNASADANTLDDYEEGSWTPSISFGGGSTGVTYSSRIGRYTKTGNEVTATTYIILSSKGSDVGIALCEGLPFVADATGGFNQPATVGYEKNITVTGRAAAWVAPGSSSLSIGAVNNGAAAFLSDTAFANNSELMITFTYKV